jgi:cytochrome c oxidase subunit 2
MRRALAIALLTQPIVAGAASPMTYMSSDGPAANPITSLGWGLLALSIFVAVFIAFAVLIGIWWKRGEGAYDDRGWPVVTRGRNGMPWLTFGVPISIFLLLLSAIWTFFTLGAIAAPPRKAPITLEVTAHQWWWEVHYERTDDPRVAFDTANEIHVPVDVPVRVRLTSADVIHSFWVPKLAGKTDTIPGQVNLAWLQANRPGVYRGQCTEFCGLQHAHMALYVIAQKGPAFRAWWGHQARDADAPPSQQAIRGQQVFETRCALCHTVRGLAGSQGNLGPDLTHVMSRRTIAAGTLTNTPGNLAAWISDAPALKPGAAMPKENLDGPQLQDLLAYLKTLK